MLTWKRSLRRLLSPRPDGQLPRVAVVGVGQRLRGDDGAGPAVAQRLAPLADAALLVVDAGHAPENCLGPIVRFRPDAILFVDAARGGLAPGELIWLRPDEADSRGGSTWSTKLSLRPTDAGVHVRQYAQGLAPMLATPPPTAIMRS